MNIFYLDRDIDQCAKYHCNKHVVKMIVEYAQLLSTAHHMLDGDSAPEGIYKQTHVNHPSAKWVRQSSANYYWLRDLAIELCAEYTRRYGKVHKSTGVHLWLSQNIPSLPSSAKTDHPQCVPDDCKTLPHDPVTAYRQYYNRYKNKFAVWEPRSRTPNWYTGQ